jgi:hypothetical protein
MSSLPQRRTRRTLWGTPNRRAGRGVVDGRLRWRTRGRSLRADEQAGCVGGSGAEVERAGDDLPPSGGCCTCQVGASASAGASTVLLMVVFGSESVVRPAREPGAASATEAGREEAARPNAGLTGTTRAAATGIMAADTRGRWDSPINFCTWRSLPLRSMRRVRASAATGTRRGPPRRRVRALPRRRSGRPCRPGGNR